MEDLKQFKAKEVLLEEDAILDMWLKKDAWRLCKYYFNREITQGQEDIVRAVAFDEHPRISICCCTRYGKSRCVEMGLLLWILRNPNRRFLLIAPTITKTAIIREYMLEDIMREPIFTELLELERSGKDRIKKEVSRSRMTWKNGVDFRTLTADKAGKGTSLMGWGAHKVVVEEVGEIPATVWNKILRMLADYPDSTYVEIGNPWNRDGPFFSHWEDTKWKKMTIDYQQALNEKRYTQAFVDEVKSDSLMTELEWQVLYEAKFPSESEDQLISYEWIKRAQRGIPEEIMTHYDQKILGVDVARFGTDLTVMTYGYRKEGLIAVKGIMSFGKQDTMTTVSKIMQLIEKENDFDEINIDADGLGGGVFDRLIELRNEGKTKARLNQFHSGESPSTGRDADQFLNKKAEAFFKLREYFEKGNIIIPEHRVLISQLGKMKWEMTSNMKKRVVDPGDKVGDTSEKKSPDFADSLCYMAYKMPIRVF